MFGEAKKIFVIEKMPFQLKKPKQKMIENFFVWI